MTDGVPMGYDPLKHPVAAWFNRGRNRRDKGRLPQETLASNLGPVLDLSAGGMRVTCAKTLKGRLTIILFDSNHRLEVTGEVTWVRRKGLFKREVGVRFINVDPATATALSQLSLNNRDRRQMHQKRDAA